MHWGYKKRQKKVPDLKELTIKLGKRYTNIYEASYIEDK